MVRLVRYNTLHDAQQFLEGITQTPYGILDA